MVAFGIGTLPGLIAASFGFRRLSTIARGGPGRVAAGFAIALFGVATVFLAHPAMALFCSTGTPTDNVAPRVNRPVTRLDRGQASLATGTLAFNSATEASGSRPTPMSPELVKRYSAPVPRYTSYPTAPHFSSDVGPETYRAWLGELPAGTRLSALYPHPVLRIALLVLRLLHEGGAAV